MDRVRMEFIDGKVLYDGRSLLAWAITDDGVWLCVDIAGSGHLHADKELPLGPFFYSGSAASHPSTF